MEQRPIPNTDLAVSVLGMGCARLGSIGTSNGRRDTHRLIAAAIDHGISLFDTASSYAQGLSETLLGEGLAQVGRQHDATIVTKIGYLPSWGPTSAQLLIKGFNRLSSRLGLGDANPQCFEPRFLRRATERSLRRLKRDHIDILMLHSPASSILERSDVRDLLDTLKHEGLIRAYGFSMIDLTTSHLEAAVGHTVIGTQPTPDTLNRIDPRKTAVLGYQVLTPADETQLSVEERMRETAQLQGVSSVVIGMSSINHIKTNAALFSDARENVVVSS